MQNRHFNLPRMERESYRGQSYVHWNLVIEGRRTGWLTPVFYYRFRELLTHTAFRYSLTCPIFCLMPDHLHLLWIGIDAKTDQLNAMKFFRTEVGESLKRVGFEFQRQAYDRILRDDQRQESALEALVEYIARNPERKGMVPVEQFFRYPYTGCLIPGYPEIRLWENNYWPRFWRCYSFLNRFGLYRRFDEQLK